jgi:transposase-like protein
MTRPRAPRPVQTADEALAPHLHRLTGYPSRAGTVRRPPVPIVVPIEHTPKLKATGPGLAGVTDAYLREWRSRHRNGGRERRTRGGCGMSAPALALTFEAAIRLADVRREKGIPASPVTILPGEPRHRRITPGAKSEITEAEALAQIRVACEAVIREGGYPSYRVVARRIGWAPDTAARWMRRLRAAGSGLPLLTREEWVQYRREQARGGAA